jgi:tRNA 2-thiouridine synthesizing protein A
MADVILDARGLSCPLPVLKAHKILRELAPGSTLEVLSTDPACVAEFKTFCLTAGHELLEVGQAGDSFSFVIKRGRGLDQL